MGGENINPAIEQAINEFLQADLPERGDAAICVILCGSQATGRATDHSDVDLCYIGDFPDFSRENRVFKGREFHLMIAPWSWYHHVITEYERQDNRGTITVMVATGRCLRGDDERWRELCIVAEHYYRLGPAPPTEVQVHKMRTRITDLWYDFVDTQEDEDQRWLAMHLVQHCVDTQFAVLQWWATKPKYQLSYLRERDADLAQLVQGCLSANLRDAARLAALCRYVLNPIGGWITE